MGSEARRTDQEEGKVVLFRCELRPSGNRYIAINLETCVAVIADSPAQTRRKLMDALEGHLAAVIDAYNAGEKPVLAQVPFYFFRRWAFDLRYFWRNGRFPWADDGRGHDQEMFSHRHMLPHGV